MRNWYTYTCKNCNREYYAHLGWVSSPFFDSNREVIYDMSSGKYGRELQEICQRIQYVETDPEEKVFICEGCGRWEVGADLTLYAPRHPERIALKKYDGKTVAEIGYDPYMSAAVLKKEYRVVKEFTRYCRKCGSRMHKASEAEKCSLPCPFCGTVNQVHPELRLRD